MNEKNNETMRLRDSESGRKFIALAHAVINTAELIPHYVRTIVEPSSIGRRILNGLGVSDTTPHTPSFLHSSSADIPPAAGLPSERVVETQSLHSAE